MISVSTTVPGGGFVRFTASPDLWKILALILFFTMTTENLGLKIRNKMRDPYNFSKITSENSSLTNHQQVKVTYL